MGQNRETSTQYRSSSTIRWMPDTCPAIRFGRACALFLVSSSMAAPQYGYGVVLLQPISWLIPLPKIHLTRHHGVLASAHPLRSRVVPSPPETEPPLTCTKKKSRWVDWADLLKRGFPLDVLACVCGARRRVTMSSVLGWMAVIKDAQVAHKILDHLGLPSRAPELGRVPDTAQGDLWRTGPPHDDFAQAPAHDEYDQRLATSDLSD
jgi:hypothetical protein